MFDITWQKISVCAISLILIALMVWQVRYSTASSVSGSEANEMDSNSVQAVNKPIIIWFHNGVTDSPEALKTALSSGLITHVIIKYMHRADADWEKKLEVRQAIEIVKQSDAQLIWCRNVWPYYKVKGVEKEDLFNPNYYIQEIWELRAEARKMGADFVAFDLEAYAYPAVKPYLLCTYKMGAHQLERLRRVMEKVIQTSGKVDFIFPAGSTNKRHPYNVLSTLGKNRITESTYYANEKRIKAVRHPYEILGAYVNTYRRREVNPTSPYFLVSDVFEKSHLWSNRKGVFLYPKEKRALAVAKELVAYAESLPNVNCIQKQRPNIVR